MVIKLLQHFKSDLFLKEYYEKRFYHFSLEDDIVNNILSINELDRIICSVNNYYPYFKLVKGKNNIDFNDYCKDFNSTHLVQINKAIEIYNQGASIVISSTENKSSNLRNACNLLSTVFKCRVGANIYITPKNSQGFPAHYDTHDVIILQTQGSKVWSLYEIIKQFPTPDMKFDFQNDQLGELTKTITLNKGDMLYIPKGMVHEAKTTDNQSTHITFGLFNVSIGNKLIDDINLKLKTIQILRENSNGLTFNEDKRKILKEKLSENIDNLNFENDATTYYENHISTDNFFKSCYILNEFDFSSNIVYKLNDIWQIEFKNREDVLLYSPFEEMEFPIETLDFLYKIFQSSSLNVNDISEKLNEKQKINIIKILINNNIIQLL